MEYHTVQGSCNLAASTSRIQGPDSRLALAVCVCMAGMFGCHLQALGILAEVGTQAHTSKHMYTYSPTHSLPGCCGLSKFGCQ